jgi:MFS family permease
VVGAPSVEHELGLSHRAYVLECFVGPLLVAAALESGISLLSDAWGRWRLVLAGQAALAASLAFLAWSNSAWGLTVGLALAGTTSGVACSAAQALLVVSDPRGPDGAMARWGLFGAVGDMVAPLLTAAAMVLGHSYRGAMAAIAVLVAIQCVGLARDAARARAGKSDREGRGEASGPRDSDPPAEPLRQALRRAVRLPRLWAWLAAAALCTLLDELVVAFAALRLHRDQGLSEALAAAAAVTFAAGSVAGAALNDRAVGRLAPRRVLLASSVLCALALAGLVFAPTAGLTCVALFLVGAACAPHHPLSLARAYEELPSNPGTVQAVAQVFVAVDIGAPLILGVVADGYGLSAALACLLLQPVAIVACALFTGQAAVTGGPRP